MRYQVPQFIEVPDKIFGPLTLRQFIYLAGGGGLCLMFVTFFPIFVSILLGIPVVGFALALAFYQVNDRPLTDTLEHAFGYYIGSKLYLWKQRVPETKAAATPSPAAQATVIVPKLSDSRLRDLAWSLNIKDRGSLSS